MFKKCLLILTAAGALTIAAAFAAAQESQSDDQAGGRSNDQTSQTTNPAHEHGCRHHNGSSDPVRRTAERTAELTAQLNLTPNQQTKVLSALQSESSQIQSVLQDTSISREDSRSKMSEIRAATDSQIRGVLDPDQQRLWDEMQTRRGQRTQRRGSATPDNSGQQQPAQ